MKSRSILREFKQYKTLLIMLAPAVIYFFIFSYLPMSGIMFSHPKMLSWS